ncbi:MAG: putative porin [Rhodospirillaceae bacterium]|nr:putative porin [Rhodospirillaceae bacterium]
MTDKNRYTQRAGRGLALAVSMAALLAAMPAGAQQGSSPAPSTSSLLEEMVATGVVTQAQADKILKGAQARDAAKAATVAQTGQGTPPAQPAVRVQYVPQIVKDEIKAELKKEVMAKAEAEGWAAPGETPEWSKRIKISGDVRGRFESSSFPSGNAVGSFDQVNFSALNARSTPFDAKQGHLHNFRTGGAAGTNALSFNNWDEDRTRERIRARVGLEADIGEGFTTGVRLATGDSSSPVSTNQTLGGSGGNFSKYQVWLDRAFIAYAPELPKQWGLNVTAGRFDNPFFGTDLVWDGDLGFDGLAAKGRYEAAKGVTPFVTAGAFPIYNTDFNFSSYSEEKGGSQDRWLYGVQAGTDWKATPDTSVKLAAAYYLFDNIGGKRKDCNYADITCGSDVFRPTFAQKGNSYMGLRNNLGSSTTPDADPNYQYFGLASGFRELALTGRVDYDGLKPLFPDQALRVSFDGEFVKNLAFDKQKVAAKSVIPGVAAGNNGLNNRRNDVFEGGDTGYLARVTVGTPKLAKRWDWSASLAYKYVESDAVVDAFTDSDFGMGGTNLKGFILGGKLALAKNVWAGAHWMSADSISGGSYSNDLFLLDLNARF